MAAPAIGRTEHEHGRQRDVRRHRRHAAIGMVLGEIAAPEGEDLRELLVHLHATSTERRRRDGSVPGARPSPRSMRPGCSASSVRNTSTTCSGEWFGTMIPPAPTRIRLGRARHVLDDDLGRRGRDCRACCGARRPNTARTRALPRAARASRHRGSPASASHPRPRETNRAAKAEFPRPYDAPASRTVTRQ